MRRLRESERGPKLFGFPSFWGDCFQPAHHHHQPTTAAAAAAAAAAVARERMPFSSHVEVTVCSTATFLRHVRAAFLRHGSRERTSSTMLFGSVHATVCRDASRRALPRCDWLTASSLFDLIQYLERTARERLRRSLSFQTGIVGTSAVRHTGDKKRRKEARPFASTIVSESWSQKVLDLLSVDRKRSPAIIKAWGYSVQRPKWCDRKVKKPWCFATTIQTIVVVPCQAA